MRGFEWLFAIISFAALMVSGASVARAQEAFNGLLRARSQRGTRTAPKTR